MFAYVLLLLIPFFVEAIETILQPYKKVDFISKRKNASIIIFFIIFFIMLALRSTSCGTDVRNYENFFYFSSKADFSDIFKDNKYIEPLYYALNWCIVRIYPDFRVILVFVAFLSTFFLGLFYKNESEHAPLTILLFVTNACFTIIFSGLRQAIAMQFMIPAYYFAKQKKLVPFILVVVLATYFHLSALIILLLYPVFHMRLKNKHLIVVLSVIAITFIFRTQLFTVLFPLIGDKYSKYTNIGDTGGYSMFFFFVLWFMISFIYPDEKKLNFEIRGLRNVIVLMTIIQSFASIHTLAMRFNYYFIMLLPIAIPKILNRPKIGNENIVQLTKWFTVVFLFFFFIYTVYSNMGIKTIYPYKAYWE